jgi:hypothetical protein
MGTDDTPNKLILGGDFQFECLQNMTLSRVNLINQIPSHRHAIDAH